MNTKCAVCSADCGGNICSPCSEKWDGTIQSAAQLVRAHDAAKAKPEAEEMSREEREALDILNAGHAEEGIKPQSTWGGRRWESRRFAMALRRKAIELLGAAEEQQRKRAEAAETDLRVLRGRYADERKQREKFESAFEQRGKDWAEDSMGKQKEIAELSTAIAAIVQLPRQYGYEQEAGEQPVAYLQRVLADMQEAIEADVPQLREEIEQLKTDLRRQGAAASETEAGLRDEVAALKRVAPALPQQPDGDELAKLVHALKFEHLGWGEVDAASRESSRVAGERLAAFIAAFIDARIAAHKAKPKPADDAPVKVGDWVVVLDNGKPMVVEEVASLTEHLYGARRLNTRSGWARDVAGNGYRKATADEIRVGRVLT